MKKIVLYLDYLLVILGVITIPLLIIWLGLTQNYFYTVLLVTLGLAVFHVILLVLREALDLNKHDNLTKAEFGVFAILGFGATIIYYVLKYAGHYNDFHYLYWIFYFVFIIASFVGGYFLYSYFKKKSKEKPKFIVNNRKR